MKKASVRTETPAFLNGVCEAPTGSKISIKRSEGLEKHLEPLEYS